MSEETPNPTPSSNQSKKDKLIRALEAGWFAGLMALLAVVVAVIFGVTQFAQNAQSELTSGAYQATQQAYQSTSAAISVEQLRVASQILVLQQTAIAIQQSDPQQADVVRATIEALREQDRELNRADASIRATIAALPTPLDGLLTTDTPAPTPTSSPVAEATVLPTLTIVSQASATNTPETTPSPTQRKVIKATVDSRVAENRTNIQLSPGNRVVIEYLGGQWRAGPLPTWPLVAAAGDPQVEKCRNRDFPMPCEYVMTLIAGIGSQVFAVGPRLEFVSDVAGELWLGPNDDSLLDNSGALEVSISVDPADGGEAAVCALPDPYGFPAEKRLRLGCPAQAYVTRRQVILQLFDGGVMAIFAKPSNVWDNKGGGFIYALSNDGRAWRIVDTFIETSNNPNDWYSCERSNGQRPEQSGVPWRGFGKAWCENAEIRRALGGARSAELPGTTADFQSYQDGRAFKLSDWKGFPGWFKDKVYVVYWNPSESDSKTGTWESQ